PVSIRVSSDPLSLLDRVLDQNPHSYTKVDDFIDIAQNLVAAGLPVEDESEGPAIEVGERELAARKRRAEQRVLGMAIEASLREDDFETAYSTAKKGYRADLRAEAVARASAVKLSLRKKRENPKAKLRGRKRVEAEGKKGGALGEVLI
ncbi:hypothetical protein LTR28_011486, partial [Elasticomyces elasticus]